MYTLWNPNFKAEWKFDRYLSGNVVIALSRVSEEGKRNWADALGSLGSHLVVLEPSMFDLERLNRLDVRYSIMLDAVDAYIRDTVMNMVQALRNITPPEVLLLPDSGITVPDDLGEHIWTHRHAQEMGRYFQHLAFGGRHRHELYYY